MGCALFARSAQSQTTAVVVSVHSAGGAAVAGAVVKLHAGTDFRAAEDLNIQTEAAGTARFADLAPGKYRMTILANGFDDLTTDIVADAAAENRIDAILNTAHTDSITVQGVIETPLEEATTPSVLDRQQVRGLPDRPQTVTDALPLAPGIVRLPNGQLRLAGNGEHRSAMLVNSATSTDPATGQFGATLPIDSVRTMSILSSPFLAEYGGFTSDVVAVETRKGGDKWTYELNDPLPEFRWRSWHMVGLRSSTPRFNFGGPVIANRLYFLESVQYEMRESPMITLPFPNNETRREGFNSLTALDYTINPSNILSATVHLADQHERYANLDFFNPQPVSPNTQNSVYNADVTEHASIRGTLLDSSLSAASFRAGVWPQGDLAMTLTPSGNLGNYFSQQTRTASRIEWRETWSVTRKLWGTHNIKAGSALGGTTEHALVQQNPVNILDAAMNVL